MLSRFSGLASRRFGQARSVLFSHAATSGSAPGFATAASGLKQQDADDPEPSTSEVSDFRRTNNFRRRNDGRVQVYAPASDAWLEAKLDGYVEGALLFRDSSKGLVYYLVSENLKQVDLSNDQLVGRLFGDGGWDELKQPLMAPVPEGPAGDMVHVRMTPQQFRSIFTVLKEGPGTGA